MKKFRMDSMPTAQCKIRIDEKENTTIITLQSYSTDVIDISIDIVDGRKQYAVICYGTYSATTSRHINRFTKEFFGTNLYHFFKANLAEWIDVNAYASTIDFTLEWYLNNGKKARY